MKNKSWAKRWPIAALGFCIGAAAWGQKTATPPKGLDVGSSLEVTMKFIQETLEQSRPATAVLFIHNKEKNTDNNGITTSGQIYKSVVANPSNCNVSFRPKAVDVELESPTVSVNLRSENAFTVLTMAEAITKDRANHGRPNVIVIKTEPTIYSVRATQNEGDAEFSVSFNDRETANQFAKAMNHAVALCHR